MLAFVLFEEGKVAPVRSGDSEETCDLETVLKHVIG